MTKKRKRQNHNHKIDTLKYRAVESDSMRRPIYISAKSEDRELMPRDRQALVSEARDALRNFTLAGFVLRKHLQSISYYRFFAGTPDPNFNAELERRVNRWKKRKNCDAAGRHGFETLLYLIESHRAIDGDVGIYRLSNGRLQIVEGDRIRNPLGDEYAEDWAHGVRVNNYGKALAYSIWQRTNAGTFEHERFVSASNFDLLGYYTRNDQIRGVSLMAPASRMFAQLYDSLDLALSKIKTEQAIALITHLNGNSALGSSSMTDAEIDNKAMDVFGPGILHLGLQAGEDATILESNNPSSNFQTFIESVIRLVFAAFDIPYSFYDGSAATFFSQRGEFEQYIDGIEKKQAPTIEMLGEWISDWLIPNWMADADDPLLIPNGWTIDDIMKDCGWSGAGLPTWRIFQHVKEMISAIQGGLISPTEAIREYGFDVKKNLDDLAELKEYAQEKGVSLPYGDPTTTNLGL